MTGFDVPPGLAAVVAALLGLVGVIYIHRTRRNTAASNTPLETALQGQIAELKQQIVDLKAEHAAEVAEMRTEIEVLRAQIVEAYRTRPPARTD